MALKQYWKERCLAAEELIKTDNETRDKRMGCDNSDILDVTKCPNCSPHYLAEKKWRELVKGAPVEGATQ